MPDNPHINSDSKLIKLMITLICLNYLSLSQNQVKCNDKNHTAFASSNHSTTKTIPKMSVQVTNVIGKMDNWISVFSERPNDICGTGNIKEGHWRD